MVSIIKIRNWFSEYTVILSKRSWLEVTIDNEQKKKNQRIITRESEIKSRKIRKYSIVIVKTEQKRAYQISQKVYLHIRKR